MKKCNKCSLEKFPEEFYQRAKSSDGLSYSCKSCEKQYRIDNKNRISDRNKMYRKNNKDKLNMYSKIWRLENKDRIKEYQKKWELDNKQILSEQSKKYYENHKEQYRRSHMRRFYGITLEEFNKILDKQDNKCKICKNNFKNSKDTHIDHCHETGKIRDLLCADCNKMIGTAKENVEILKEAIKYLENWKEK